MTLSAADKIEIQELVARYNRAIDGGNPDEWADTFTADGVFEGLVVGSFSGRDELLGFAQEFWRDPKYQEWWGAQHWTTNMIIEGDGDKATLFAYHIMFTPDGQGATPALLAGYQDELSRVDGRWRFSKRKVIPWPPASAGSD